MINVFLSASFMELFDMLFSCFIRIFLAWTFMIRILIEVDDPGSYTNNIHTYIKTHLDTHTHNNYIHPQKISNGLILTNCIMLDAFGRGFIQL